MSPSARAVVERLRAVLQGQDFGALDALAAEARTEAEARPDDVALRAASAEARAQADYHLGRYAEALGPFGTAIDGWRAVGEPGAEARAHIGRAGLLSHCGLSTESLEEGYAALALLDAASEPSVRISAHIAVGRSHASLRAWDEAERRYEQALSIGREHGDVHEIARVVVELGYFWSERAREARERNDRTALAGFARHGVERNREALGLFAAVGQSKHEWIALANLGEALMDLGDLDGAREAVDRMLASVRRAPVPSVYCEAAGRTTLGQIALARQDPAAAATHLAAALDLAEHHGMDEQAMRCHELLTDAFAAQRDFRTALDHHRRFFAMHRQVLSGTAQLRAAVLAAEHDTAETRAAFVAEQARAQALARDNLELQRESLEDSLTGLPNHRAFRRAFNRLALAHAQPDESLAHVTFGVEFHLAVIDVDDFKRINDGHSHAIGDDVLKAVGEVLARECREGDHAARYGGEEFTILLADTSRIHAVAACERIRLAIAAYPWSRFGDLAVTVSIGLAGSLECGDRTAMFASMFARADRRLYRAKNDGKNRVVADD